MTDHATPSAIEPFSAEAQTACRKWSRERGLQGKRCPSQDEFDSFKLGFDACRALSSSVAPSMESLFEAVRQWMHARAFQTQTYVIDAERAIVKAYGDIQGHDTDALHPSVRPTTGMRGRTSAPGALPHDWTEDFPGENGNYQCRCMECEALFYGHKRRLICKVCAKRSTVGDMVAVPRKRLAQWESWARQRGRELLELNGRLKETWAGDSLADEMRDALSAIAPTGEK